MLPTAASKRRTFAARYFTRSKSLVMGEQSRSPGRPPCPHKSGPVLKAGWLKKQRSIMKNWQQRWFVLRGDQLFYYKDKDETKPQGFISLQGTQVTELLPGPEDPGKHLFEISPGSRMLLGTPLWPPRACPVLQHPSKHDPQGGGNLAAPTNATGLR
ncbi:rho GTPase-activating protein 22 isoform X10 [Oryctolagus cuniculus]|uniref:rho GTPase-activating protein 22 isoform X10 n=1 Tax=Oryctolagus cuniculus TaxID=9986 RepID=UPI00222E7F9D|nr:rho GTPase-activating protein 22 isoform X10 [Oryctolagus cuniculus]